MLKSDSFTSTPKSDPYLSSAFTPAPALLTHETTGMAKRDSATNLEKGISHRLKLKVINNILPWMAVASKSLELHR